jgi:hypothetical protein
MDPLRPRRDRTMSGIRTLAAATSIVLATAPAAAMT